MHIWDWKQNCTSSYAAYWPGLAFTIELGVYPLDSSRSIRALSPVLLCTVQSIDLDT